VPADIFVEYLIAIMLFPYVRFRNEAVKSQTPWDDMVDRAEWMWQVRGCIDMIAFPQGLGWMDTCKERYCNRNSVFGDKREDKRVRPDLSGVRLQLDSSLSVSMAVEGTFLNRSVIMLTRWSAPFSDRQHASLA
jgi:hypothetical protein